MNSWSHAIGIPLSVVAAVFLFFNKQLQTTAAFLAIGVYAFSLLSMYAVSTTYHSVLQSDLKQLLRKLDHIGIYFLIAGTYTPVLVIAFPGNSGYPLLYAVWGIAGLGTFLKILFFDRFEKFSLFLYLIMGWLIVFDLSVLMENTTSLGRSLLMAGGIFYSVGAVFYSLERIKLNHFIWHLFVLAGSACHYFFIFCDVVKNQS